MNGSYQPEPYWDEVAQNIAARSDLKEIAGDDEPYYRYKRKRFLQLLQSLDFAGKRVLEIGSGPGGNLDFIHRKGCRSISGADISSRMIELARRNLQGKTIEIVKINGRDLPFPDAAFDTVFTSTVLQHNTDELALRQLVSEICRVSSKEVLFFERIESRIRGHESNHGRPVSYYEALVRPAGFRLVQKKSLPIQASYYACGAIRKLFNPKDRKEGEALSAFSIAMEKLVLPLTALLDRVVPSNRDVTLLRFERAEPVS